MTIIAPDLAVLLESITTPEGMEEFQKSITDELNREFIAKLSLDTQRKTKFRGVRLAHLLMTRLETSLFNAPYGSPELLADLFTVNSDLVGIIRTVEQEILVIISGEPTVIFKSTTKSDLVEPFELLKHIIDHDPIAVHSATGISLRFKTCKQFA